MMGLVSQQVHKPPPSYLSAPTSPDNLQFYSAPTSPMASRIRCDTTSPALAFDQSDDEDDFEFETSHKFAGNWKSESSPTFVWPVDDHTEQPLEQQQQQNPNLVHRANSFSSTMTFADQLFVNGQVLPLKLPPRLQQQQRATADQSQGSSIATSPRSPSSVLRIPFGHRSTWNDNFDPFMVALEKVSDETTSGRKSIHRRARSHSPFRTTSTQLEYCTDGSAGCNQDQQKQADSPGAAQIRVPKLNHEMVEAKGSAYARWVRSHTMEHKRSSSVIPSSSKSLTKAKTSLFGKGTRGRHEGSAIVKKTGETDGIIGFGTETKMQKVKSILLKYASFGKENNAAGNYFKRLSVKFKGSDQKKKKKKVAGESKIMALVKYNPKRPLCLGYVPASPTHM